MPPTLLFLGDLDERHGADLLVRAMPAIHRHHPNVRLTLIGDGPLHEPLAAYARYLQLEEFITFLPARPTPGYAEAIHSADVMIVPGRVAVAPEALDAAWFAHKPVVATHEAASAFAEHERNALLVYPSENGIATAVVRLLHDPELARKLGEAGYQRLLDEFTKCHTRSDSPLDTVVPNHDLEL